MIKIITLIIKCIVSTLIALFFSSCNPSFNFGIGIKGSGNITTETRTVSGNFKNIEVSEGIKVIVAQSNTKSITVEADDNLQQHIITKVENGVLIIESDKSYNATETPIVNVKMIAINGLSANSGSKITSSNVLITENIKVKSNSGSQIEIDIEADAISLESTSGSSIEARGKALKLTTTSTSGSQINAENLMTNEVVSETSSRSSTDVYPILKLEAKASSGSAINYYKTPKIISKKESSGGSVSEN
jgi:hypothetical protein